MAGVDRSTVRRQDPADVFFADLARGACRAASDEPALQEASGTIEIELLDGPTADRAFVRIDGGKLLDGAGRVAGADAVIHGERSTFNEIVQGQANAVGALLRGALWMEGDLGLVTAFARSFPGGKDRRRQAQLWPALEEGV